MAYEKRVKVTKGGSEAEVMESSVKLYKRLGWTTADDGSSEESSTEESAPEAPAKKTAAKKATTRKAD